MSISYNVLTNILFSWNMSFDFVWPRMTLNEFAPWLLNSSYKTLSKYMYLEKKDRILLKKKLNWPWNHLASTPTTLPMYIKIFPFEVEHFWFVQHRVCCFNIYCSDQEVSKYLLNLLMESRKKKFLKHNMRIRIFLKEKVKHEAWNIWNFILDVA